jgi:outer membrane protein OmpA-like peptidoglycan-associated protein
MNISLNKNLHGAPPLAVCTAVAALLAACASAPRAPPAAEAVRERLTALRDDPALAGKADVALQDAEAAVRSAEMPERDKVLTAQRVYLADRKVESARAQAEMRVAEEQQTELANQRERARLEARTREADAAAARARTAQMEGEAQKLAAEAARNDAGTARMQAKQLEREAGALREQISDLEAKVTERGIVMTVGDMLFTSGKANLQTGTTGNLDKLAAFLDDHPQRMVRIEGHTDSAGSSESNYDLSQRRAESVKSYLMERGVAASRLTTVGFGEDVPLADNASAIGRQVNRRVEVIISNEASASASN